MQSSLDKLETLVHCSYWSCSSKDTEIVWSEICYWLDFCHAMEAKRVRKFTDKYVELTFI